MNPHVVLGLWPIAAITTVGVTEVAAEATIAAAIDSGIRQFDTAYSYGSDGRSDRLLGRCIGSHREKYQIIGKVGQRWLSDGTRVNDGSAKTLTADAEESLRRMGSDYFDTLMLHAPDPNTPLAESAAALASLKQRGLCRRIGVCNVSVDQFNQFANHAPCQAVQCPLNLLQQDQLSQLIPACRQTQCDVYAYWTLMKGLLAGKIGRDHVFQNGDLRPSYSIFQGEPRERAHQILDRLQLIGEQCGKTIAQLTIGWVLSQPGVTAALVGAHRPNQIIETAGARPLGDDLVLRINAAVST